MSYKFNTVEEALQDIKPAKFTREIAFNSARKWSAIEIAGQKWVLGAPEIVFAADKKNKILDMVLLAASVILAVAKAIVEQEKPKDSND